ncbi:MAG: aldolase/citrate lyase family protein, partial [Rhizomicrobium sp.]
LEKAHEDICLILQIESRAGLDAIEDIAAVEGVDALFIGPGDLAGALGHLGDAGHASVQAAISDTLSRAKKAGKPTGIFATSAENAKQNAAAGAILISIGTDIGLLSNGAMRLRKSLDL